MRYKANDLGHHWLPFTDNRSFKENPRLVVKASGAFYTSHQGNEILDACSGLFCTPAGHGRTEIADAVRNSLLEMDYVPHLQHGHPSSFELAQRVAQLTPGNLDRIFFINSGSEAVETALKIALLYHRRRGEGHRQRIIGRMRGYHGVNFAGFSVGGMVRNRDNYGLGLPGVAHMRHTWLPENCYKRDCPDYGVELAEDLALFCECYGGDTIAACIVEPVAGSAGCLVPPKGYLERLREICDMHGILLIFDEVITGFGRMGSNFAGHRFGVQADIMTMAKALTNGAIPMGAVAVSDPIYNCIIESGPKKGIEFYHGNTYSGHPAACAAALATLDIYQEEKLFERAAALETEFLDAVFGFEDLPIVKDIRGIGLLATIELVSLEQPGQFGADLIDKLYQAGLFVKITGDNVILAPPFIFESAHIDQMATILRKVFKTV